MQYRYSAFGIKFESDIPFPELLANYGGRADVKIKIGKVPNRILDPLEISSFIQVSNTKFLMKVEGVAGFYVINGQQVIVDLFNNQDLGKVRLFLLGTIMGVLLMQRGVLPLHGSTVEVEKKCVMFVGDSGAGKSTLAAALHNSGHSLLADDISGVKFDEDGLPWVQSGYPQQKLLQSSASMLGIDTTQLERISDDLNKYAVPTYEGFCRDPKRLQAVYAIEESSGDSCSIAAMEGVEKLMTIMRHTYRSRILRELELKLSHFKNCANIAKQVPVFKLLRPNNLEMLHDEVNILRRHVAKLNGSELCNVMKWRGNCETTGN